MKHLLIAALLLGLSACATATAPGSSGGAALGSEQNPIRVNMPAGEREYLSRLRCSDGAAPQFRRIGNAGVGVNGNIVDVYDVRCPNGEPRQSQIWMDMYYPSHRENGAPPGFTIVPR
jgi:hypothetical protein